MIPKRVAGRLTIVATLLCPVHGFARSDGPIPFPTEYREWAHVKSVLVGPQAPSFPTEGGIHHIYANPKAVEGYRSGTFPDGSVVVYNLLEVTATNGLTVEGPQRRLDMMVKDSQKYRETGGWGFARFMGENRTDDTLTADAQRSCFACHQKRKDHDSVFSEFRK
jgi:hypothetical protein